MAIKRGNEGLVIAGANTVQQVKSWTMEESAKISNGTVIGDDWEKKAATTKSGNGTFECLWDKADTTGQGSIAVGSEVALTLQPEGATVGDVEYTCQAVITGVSRSGNNDDYIPVSYTWEANGAITEGTV